MLKIGCCLGLDVKSLDVTGRRQLPGQDHLECDNAIQLRMASPINDSHASAGDFVEKLVVAKTPFGPDARGCIPIEQPGIDCCFRVDITSYAFSKRFFAGVSGRCRRFGAADCSRTVSSLGSEGSFMKVCQSRNGKECLHYTRL